MRSIAHENVFPKVQTWSKYWGKNIHNFWHGMGSSFIHGGGKGGGGVGLVTEISELHRPSVAYFSFSRVGFVPSQKRTPLHWPNYPLHASII